MPAWLLARSARHFGLTARIYGPADPPIVELAAEFPDLMAQKTGAGYWLWKPTIILDALENADDGDVVIYSDAAALLIADPAPLLALSIDHPIILFELSKEITMRKWTKRDCFVALDADSPDYWNMVQLAGAAQVFRAGAESRAFVGAVVEACQVPGVLDDSPNVRGRANHPDFVAHRHDQSVLSIVARQHGLPVFPDPSEYGPCAPREEIVRGDGWVRPAAPYGQIVSHHRRRNTATIRYLLTGRFSWYLGRAA